MKSQTTLAAITVLLLSGCAQTGNLVAAWYDSQDPCQIRGRVGYQPPTWCGASNSGLTVQRGYAGPVVSTIRPNR